MFSAVVLTLALLAAVLIGYAVYDRRRLLQRAGKLTDSVETYGRLIENAGDGIFISDVSGTVTFANERLAAMFERPLGSIIGADLPSLVDPEARGDVARIFGRSLESGKAYDMWEIQARNKAGEPVIFQVSASIPRGPGGQAAFVQGIVRDITEKKRLEKDLLRQSEELKRIAEEMTTLYNIGFATTSSLNLDEVLSAIHEQISRLMDASTFFIALYDEQNDQLRFELAFDKGKLQEKFSVARGAGLTGYVIENRKPLLFRDLMQEWKNLPVQHLVIGDPARSWLGIPLILKDKVIGVLNVQSYEPSAFDEEHMRILTMIAAQAAIAIENARLYAEVKTKNEMLEQSQAELRRVNAALDQELAEVTRLHRIAEQLAITDGVTGLYNHRHFQERLGEEVARTARYGRPLSLIMIDIDNFKSYNDAYGHLAGDVALRAVAKLLTRTVRSTDFVARYGGEEFVIILLEAGKDEGLRIAEKIRQRVEQQVFPGEESQPGGNLTVSVGVATFPTHAASKQELIEAADRAMYIAKRNGRNRVSSPIIEVA